MLLPIYTLVAIANIVAKSHNYNIDHELNPYLRVKKSIGENEIIPNLDPVESDEWSDVDRPSKDIVIRDKENKPKFSISVPGELNVNKSQSRLKRSYYMPISRPLDKVTTPKTLNVSSTTQLYDFFKPNTTTTESSFYNDYNDDYENGGNFIFRIPTVVDTTKNKTDKNPNIEFNNSTKNNTQAYYPLSHTFIPGYNQPQDVFNFEKGSVYTNSTKGNKTNSKQNYEEPNILTKDFHYENKTRTKRSYYMAIPLRGKPGNAQTYYPLSHTYIPGYNTQDDVFNNQGQVLPNSKNKTIETPNTSKETKPKEKEVLKFLNNKAVRTPETTTKHSLHRITRIPQLTKRRYHDDYEDYTQLHPKNRSPFNTESQITKQNGERVSFVESLDYDNDGEFIVYPHRNIYRGKPKQENRTTPNRPQNRPQTGKHPKPDTKNQYKESKEDSEEKMDIRYMDRRDSGRKHTITRLKRSYYEKNNGYRPLSHTYIPGYNEQEDVWRYEGGQVYPYPSNGDGDNTDVQNANGNKNHRIKSDRDERRETQNNKHKNQAKDKKDKDESLLDKIIIKPIKNLFGFRKKRSVNFDIPKNNAIILRKRNGVTDFFNNMVEKIHNYTRSDHVVIIDENNIHNGKTNENYITSVPDPYRNGYDDRGNPNTPYNGNEYNTQYQGSYDNGQYNPYKQNYPGNRAYTPYKNGGYQYAPGYNSQQSYQSNYNDINNSFFQTINNNKNSLSQKITSNKEGTVQNVTDEIEENVEVDTDDERIIKETCFMCRSNGCPVNYKKLGPSCVKIG